MIEARKKYEKPTIHRLPQPCVELHEHMFLLTGGPGTGKSTVTKLIQQRFINNQHSVDAFDIDDFRTMYPNFKMEQLIEAHAHQTLHAQVHLSRGVSVALSGVYGRESYRQEKAEIAKKMDVPFFTVHIDVPYEVRLARVLARPHDSTSDVREKDLFDQIERSLDYRTGIDLRINGMQTSEAIWAEIFQKQQDLGLIRGLRFPNNYLVRGVN